MSWTLGPGPEYRKIKLPPTGYLAASSNRSDVDCLRPENLEVALRARRERDGFRVVTMYEKPIELAISDRVEAWLAEVSTAELAFWVCLGCAIVLAATLIVSYAR